MNLLEALRESDRDRAHGDVRRALLKRRQHALIAKDRLLDGLVVGKHGDDNIAGGRFGRAVHKGSPLLLKRFGAAFGSIVDAETMARLQYITRHRKAHIAKADKADIHCRLLLSSNLNASCRSSI